MTEYQLAPEVEEIGNQLIRTVPRHQDLKHVPVMFVFRDRAARSKGRTVLACARRIGGLSAFLAAPSKTMQPPHPFFVIEVARDTWRELNEDQRLALIDHELCHCDVDRDPDGIKETRLSILGHDYEEFAEIIARHGFWLASDDPIKKAVQRQLVLAVDQVTEFVGSLTSDDDGGAS